MKLREQSQVGYLMAQWLGVLAPSVFLREMAGASRWDAATDAERQEAIDQLHAYAEALPGEPLTQKVHERARASSELIARAKRIAQRKMKPPPADSVFTACASCSRVVPATEWDHLYDSCNECAERAASYGNNWREAWAEFDRDRLVQEEQAGA